MLQQTEHFSGAIPEIGVTSPTLTNSLAHPTRRTDCISTGQFRVPSQGLETSHVVVLVSRQQLNSLISKQSPRLVTLKSRTNPSGTVLVQQNLIMPLHSFFISTGISKESISSPLATNNV